MTLSWAAAQELWELAEQKGDVCSVWSTDLLPKSLYLYSFSGTIFMPLKLNPVSDILLVL